jgi:hypothetical protein
MYLGAQEYKYGGGRHRRHGSSSPTNTRSQRRQTLSPSITPDLPQLLSPYPNKEKVKDQKTRRISLTHEEPIIIPKVNKKN